MLAPGKSEERKKEVNNLSRLFMERKISPNDSSPSSKIHKAFPIPNKAFPIPKKGNPKELSNYHTIALISHASEVMLKILQARLQQYVNR